ncbi:uncharacterized protein RJT20DRAFT_135358 [Scheffersomyces xylosifermentans]|uniref:uncharacterized protein n=1 Tax=Scheffersomyces xylosifermentans TaxID=1304137 RepID=UPI00315CF9AB
MSTLDALIDAQSSLTFYNETALEFTLNCFNYNLTIFKNDTWWVNLYYAYQCGRDLAGANETLDVPTSTEQFDQEYYNCGYYNETFSKDNWWINNTIDGLICGLNTYSFETYPRGSSKSAGSTLQLSRTLRFLLIMTRRKVMPRSFRTGPKTLV